MTDLRVPARLPAPAAPARTLPPARAEAVRAAQRAFFEAALAGEPHPAAAGVSATAPAAPAAVPPVAAAQAPAFGPAAPPLTRLLRPGSLVDIKV